MMSVTPEKWAAAAAKNLANARKQLDIAMSVTQEVARDLHKAGWSEYVIADRLGVTRMTVRKWLGKQ